MKEFDVYKDIIYAFKSRKLKFNSKDIKNMINNYLKFHGIPRDYLKKIIFNRDDIFYYDINNNSLYIDYQFDLFDDIVDEDDSISQMTDILTSIFHELVHMEELSFRVLLFNSPFISKQFARSLQYVCDKKSFSIIAQKYDDYHDYFLFEYYAEIISFIKFEKLYLKYLSDYIDKHIIETNNIYIALELLSLYENYDINNSSVSYPLLNNKMLCHINDDNFYSNIDKLLNSNLTEFDKLKRGLPVKDETLKYLDRIANEKVKTYKLFEDIKRIPN